MPRSVVAIALPHHEFVAVEAPLAEAGYEAVEITSPDELSSVLAARAIGVAVLDGETDFGQTIELYDRLHADGRKIPALVAVSRHALDRMRLAGHAGAGDEYFSRPYNPDSLRWRIEAMLIRSEMATAQAAAQVSSQARGPFLDATATTATAHDHGRSGGRIAIVFNPKGGVGKTTIAINLAAAMQLRKDQRVLLIDADTITGHVATSLAIDRPETVVSVWRAEKEPRTGTFAEVATQHRSGVSVVVLSESPIHTEVLEPTRIAQEIGAARAAYDWVIVDMHPDYGPLNQHVFALADRILVPVTPDVPCIRAAVQFREVAVELGIRERLVMVANRSNSGVSVSDVEKTVGMPAVARIRSAGMLFVRAANEGQSAVERFPGERVVGDIEALADWMVAPAGGGAGGKEPAAGPTRGIGGRVRRTFGWLTGGSRRRSPARRGAA